MFFRKVKPQKRNNGKNGAEAAFRDPVMDVRSSKDASRDPVMDVRGSEDAFRDPVMDVRGSESLPPQKTFLTHFPAHTHKVQ